MHITSAHLTPIAAIVAGVFVLLMPRFLSWVVGLSLITFGMIGLNGIYHFVK